MGCYVTKTKVTLSFARITARNANLEMTIVNTNKLIIIIIINFLESSSASGNENSENVEQLESQRVELALTENSNNCEEQIETFSNDTDNAGKECIHCQNFGLKWIENDTKLFQFGF